MTYTVLYVLIIICIVFSIHIYNIFNKKQLNNDMTTYYNTKRLKKFYIFQDIIKIDDNGPIWF